eukprot:7553984-Ditylum_brightwellii.AAC.2
MECSYTEGSTPSNFTAFSFFEQQPLERDDVCKRALFLILVSTVGWGKTLKDIKKLAKKSVRVPTDFSGLKTQLSYWMGACKIFFGIESVPVEKLEELNTRMIKYKHQFKAKASMEEKFLGKILYMVDTILQQWMVECRKAQDRSEVDDKIIEF